MCLYDVCWNIAVRSKKYWITPVYLGQTMARSSVTCDGVSGIQSKLDTSPKLLGLNIFLWFELDTDPLECQAGREEKESGEDLSTVGWRSNGPELATSRQRGFGWGSVRWTRAKFMLPIAETFRLQVRFLTSITYQNSNLFMAVKAQCNLAMGVGTSEFG